MKKNFTIIITIFIVLSSCSKTELVMKIGLVADPQYADKPTVGNKHYRQSLYKLEEAINTFNDSNVDFVQNLGDIIDSKWISYDSILPIYNGLKPGIENHHLLGNHDFSIDKAYKKKLLDKLSMPDYYYSYYKEGWRFIVLDATDYSYYSSSLHNHDVNQVDYYFEYTKEKSNNHRWNSAIGKEQQKWLKQELTSAESLNQKVIIFSHLPIRPQGKSSNLWNDYEIVDIIENSPNVVAFINGHNHSGRYIFKNGINYITISGMLNTRASSYGILEIYKDSLILRGYGNQKTIYLE